MKVIDVRERKCYQCASLLASQKAAYHPSSGYYWKTNSSSGSCDLDIFASGLNWSIVSDDLASKDSSKEKMLTQTQQYRFNAIFSHFRDRFRPRAPPGATTQSALPSSTANNESAANNGASGDGNLPRMCLAYRSTSSPSFPCVSGKEERTPSDSQSTTSERPMVEVKKLKTQK